MLLIPGDSFPFVPFPLVYGIKMFFNMLEAYEKHRRVTNMKRGCRNSAASVLCGLLIFRSGHCQLEVLGVSENFLLVGILLLFLGALDNQRQSQHIDGQRSNGNHALGNRIYQGRTDSGIHEAVSIQYREGSEDAPILEQGNT